MEHLLKLPVFSVQLVERGTGEVPSAPEPLGEHQGAGIVERTAIALKLPHLLFIFQYIFTILK